MTFEEILKQLKEKNYRPIYFLMGEEPYFIDRITDYIADHVLTEEEKTFNQIILYGKDTDIPTIINTARRFPMMASRQVVIVREAQSLEKIEDLIHYVDHPLESTILVINYKYKKLDKRKKLFKALEKNSILFESKRLYDDKIPPWINSYLRSRGKEIEPKAAVILTEYLGSDLGKIANELEKLIIVLKAEQDMITPADIERNIGISKDYNNFELNNALARRDVLKANRIARYFGANQKNHPLALTITSIYFFFSKVLRYHFLPDKSSRNVASALKIEPFFIREYETAARNYNTPKTVQIISLLREYDLKSKGFGNVSAVPGDLLKELIYKIIH
ncbi:MAG: DNA polymerase III subunit delta [Bacteroides sp. SM23_62]|nr:MAG: DNA polymerase III subunit delta [Bacteroides sp. SM23_62]